MLFFFFSHKKQKKGSIFPTKLRNLISKKKAGGRYLGWVRIINKNVRIDKSKNTQENKKIMI